MPEQNIPPTDSSNVGNDDSTDHPTPWGWGAKPAFMYLHYLRGEDDSIPVYLFQIADPETTGISPRDISSAITAIQHNAATPVPRGAKGVEWRALSYMVFVLSDTNEQFEYPYVRFRHENTHHNHTFLEPMVTNTGGCSVFYCTNFRKNRYGNPLEGSSEHYKWESQHLKRGKLTMLTHTDSGQNTGP